MKNTFTLCCIALLLACLSANAQPANIPYSCDFENTTENSKWTIPTSPTTNRWVFGTAEYNSYSRSAYISTTTAGTTAGYNNVNNSLPMYREFNTELGKKYTISFDAKVYGDYSNYYNEYYYNEYHGSYEYRHNYYDGLYVYWITNPSVNIAALATATYPPIADNYANGIYYGYCFAGYNYWSTYKSTNYFPFEVVGTGSTARLVFIWVNNNSINNNPGACIDNIKIEPSKTTDYNTSIWVNRETPYSSYTPEELVKNVFIKGGDCSGSVSNVTFKGLGWNQTTKQWMPYDGKRSLAYFSHGTTSGLGITDGILLATGNAKEAEGPNVSTGAMQGGILGTDTDLSTLVTSNITTVSILEFDFVPSTNIISFDYVFASEEYPVYSCSDYNDVFGFWISGTGIPGGKKNIALIPGTNDPVSIEYLHPDYYSCIAKNSEYYVNGGAGSSGDINNNLYTEFNGHTKMFKTASQAVVAGQIYHLKLAIANVGDIYTGILGSGVFLRAGSLDLGGSITNHGSMVSGMNNVFEGCGNNQFVIDINPPSSNVYMTLTYSGTASGDIVSPDGTPLPTSILVTPGTTQVVIPYKVNSPVFANGGTFTISIDFACASGTLSHTIYVYAKATPTFNINTPCGATSGTVTVTSVTGGTSGAKLSVDATNTWYKIPGFSTTLSVGNHQIHIKDSVGCEHIININVPSKLIANGIDTQTACDSYMWINGTTYTSNNNTATHTLTGAAKNGCDSIVTLNLTIKNKASGTDTQTSYGSYVWIDGNTYTESNSTATHTITGGAKNGCDSIVTLNLTIINTAYGIDKQVACDSYKWIDGNTYTSSTNTPTHTITGGSSAGGDSIVTLNLTIKYTTYSIDTQTACDSYTWIDGNTYTLSNNTATHTITNKAGCDSIITLNLTITHTTYSIDTQTACDSYTWIDGNTYTLSNNTATHIITNSAGCDSIITLNLTITNTIYSIDTQNACDSYTWIDGNTYTSSNNTATHTITNSSGCNNIVTLDLTVKYTTYGIDTQTACDGYKWIDGNTYTSSNNTATHTITNLAGCDSIVTLNLTVKYTTYGIDTQTACDSYKWIDGVTYTSNNNTATHTIQGGAVNGCDSIVTLNLTIIDKSVSIIISEPICANDGEFSLTLTPNPGAVMPTDYKIDFVEKTVPSGFVNFASQQGTINSGVINVQIPEKLYPDTYSCTLILSDNIDGCNAKSYQINYAVLYPSSIMEQKWGDVIALLKKEYNGGYEFAGYQWYHSGQEMIGETQSYVYIKNSSLVEGDDYSVQITREDGSTAFSCPFIAKVPNACSGDYPTVIPPGTSMPILLPYKTATVRLITVTGIVLSSKAVNSGDEIVVPTQQGVYILEILSGNKKKEVVKIIVK